MDRNAMPYVQAVIHEGQRVADIVPLSMFHTATTNAQLWGYNIPKVTFTRIYVWQQLSLHHSCRVTLAQIKNDKRKSN
uniref:Uncharacterized protein n=1 Tax=Sinocyclocheilus rhinocerous TaxID=307959 RepID=A0A673IEU4_9TELE